ncbi:signal peptide peptidase SppA [Magnetospira sp. QH-2]|uniref:signal peptide peptidase SppA n=1 Tax=Magnetospira sp. (strain QH-2) TaxID=1288970 RepID=UPI0005FA44C8|nr:signal peptide peptidase SppA [Magnetospira sp. QH-2]
MNLDSDALLLIRRLKRQLTVWRLGGVALLALLLIVLLADGIEDVGDEEDTVARLTITGVILDDPWRSRTLRKVMEKEHIKALLVHIDSPGGTVVGSESLYRVLMDVAEEKPVVAIMGQVAASGGYMTALGTDRIYAQAGTITGSIGVILQTTDMTGLMDMIGLKPESIKSSPLKAQPNPLEPLTPEARAATKAVVLDMYDMFVDMVADRRKLEDDKARTLADGRIYTGRQALENGLIDALGDETDARDWLAEEHEIDLDWPVAEIKIDRPKTRWQRLIGETMGKVLFSEELTRRLSLDGLLALWHPSL